MKKNLPVTLLSAALLAGSLNAFGQGESTGAGKTYLTANVGGSFASTEIENTDVDFNIGVRLDIAFGYHLSEPLSLELETGWMWNSVDQVGGESLPDGMDLSLYQIPILVNVVYHFETSGKWKPYVGGGIGGVYSILSVETPVGDDSESSFAFGAQFKGGVGYLLNDNAMIDFGYKLLYSGEQDWGGINSDSIFTHGFLLSFTYSF